MGATRSVYPFSRGPEVDWPTGEIAVRVTKRLLARHSRGLICVRNSR